MQNIKEDSGSGEKFVYPKTAADFKRLYKKLKAYARLKLFNKYPILKPEMDDLFQDAMITLFMDFVIGSLRVGLPLKVILPPFFWGSVIKLIRN
jgi:hypothetical protein